MQGQREGLELAFLEREVSDVIVDSDGNKSPGPNGFNFNFFKKFWDILKRDVMTFFDDFHKNSKLPASLSSYFITLIPKVLSRRLGKVMDSIVAKNQLAFLKGRSLADGVVVVNEVVDLARRSKKECVIFKVDFAKAYDS
ncbi:LINE-1 reverse transcriptase like, partial [Trifolium medium]|nr:LINE-1 reverse transcriptase like [Trifolium medium]